MSTKEGDYGINPSSNIGLPHKPLALCTQMIALVVFAFIDIKFYKKLSTKP